MFPILNDGSGVESDEAENQPNNIGNDAAADPQPNVP
jgi:hypothetical protein